jgi:hypothetical protein
LFVGSVTSSDKPLAADRKKRSKTPKYDPTTTWEEHMATNPNQKLAVLIDADNAQASVIQELLAEVSRYGTATIKRAYGDWTTTNLKGWKDVLHTMAIQPIQ